MHRSWLFALFLTFAGTVVAEPLEGRLFLGKNLEVYLQEDESLLVRFLRRFSMVRRRQPVYPLRTRCRGGLEIFVGADRMLYALDPSGPPVGYMKIGDARDPDDIHLDPGAQLRLVTEILAPFTGVDQAKKLKVETDTRIEHVEKVEKADLRAYLVDLQTQVEDEGPAILDLPANRGVYEAILESLPVAPGGDAASTALFHQLEGLVASGAIKHDIVIESLIGDVITRVKAAKEEGKEEPEALDEILARYQKLLDSVKRSS